ncbi:hypothetical protein UFOVP1346_56 [uncultured Caudovirales phage]|uniref:Uncharacterized protein n=1 Tax=uncultured Caudovirales phage TaxID=2100421 RepID=A0A6J5QU67_9CAUD|nr:hypothetical protein UFOVP921_36 [uncultured Caudovirales phage]CAB4187292.1 hypothetical protein UFOVP1156_12 [uncultured Caudovirales phage]CAB4200676.1 hypothetical protein UFOVP1346_56 [uncultured Caudovirales phage]
MLDELIKTDLAIIAIALVAHTTDKHLLKTGLVNRAVKAARILSGTDGIEVPSWRHPVLLMRTCGHLIRAAWRGGESALPRWARIALVCAFIIPILGPIDELGGCLTLVILALTPKHRLTVTNAWNDSAATFA